MTRGPILIDLETESRSPAEVPPVPEIDNAALPVSMTALAGSNGKISRLGRWLGAATAALVSAWVGIALWSFINGLLQTHPVIGLAFSALVSFIVVLLVLIASREWLAFRRLAMLDRLQEEVGQVRESGGKVAASKAARRIMELYSSREDMRWKLSRVEEQLPDQMDSESVLTLLEAELMEPLDQAALKEVEAAARRVASVTALVPIAAVDVLTALAANLRMVRAVAQIYGGRSGTLGSWKLVRAVVAHLVATGAVAIGDDLIGSVAGGALAGKISRRFGEGVINGALTARVGITAMALCRPMPFVVRDRPKTAGTVKRALTGVFRKD